MIKLESSLTDPPADWNKKLAKKVFKKMKAEIAENHQKLYASKKQSILVVLQGMDASGKDGLIRDLFSALPAYSVKVKSFAKPTALEAAHDFLWRAHKEIPARGIMKIFNRSYYEDILEPYVNGTISINKIEDRIEQINEFESLLKSEGIYIVKLFLHISFQEQRVQLQQRLNDPTKYWKHRDEDWKKRKKWSQYMAGYELIFQRCDIIPWHVIPANNKWVKLYSSAKVMMRALREINPGYPPLKTEIF